MAWAGGADVAGGTVSWARSGRRGMPNTSVASTKAKRDDVIEPSFPKGTCRRYARALGSNCCQFPCTDGDRANFFILSAEISQSAPNHDRCVNVDSAAQRLRSGGQCRFHRSCGWRGGAVSRSSASPVSWPQPTAFECTGGSIERLGDCWRRLKHPQGRTTPPRGDCPLRCVAIWRKPLRQVAPRPIPLDLNKVGCFGPASKENGFR